MFLRLARRNIGLGLNLILLKNCKGCLQHVGVTRTWGHKDMRWYSCVLKSTISLASLFGHHTAADKPLYHKTFRDILSVAWGHTHPVFEAKNLLRFHLLQALVSHRLNLSKMNGYLFWVYQVSLQLPWWVEQLFQWERIQTINISKQIHSVRYRVQRGKKPWRQ